MSITKQQAPTQQTQKDEFEELLNWLFNASPAELDKEIKQRSHLQEIPNSESKVLDDEVTAAAKAGAAKSNMTLEAFLNLTDKDLLPGNRTEANYWRAQYFQAKDELRKANKGIRRLGQGKDRATGRVETICNNTDALLATMWRTCSVVYHSPAGGQGVVHTPGRDNHTAILELLINATREQQ